MMDMEHIKFEIKQVISNRLEETQNIEYDTRLADVGFDSLETISLVVELEALFDFEFEDEKLSYETLRTIDSIARYVYERTGSGIF